MKLTDLLRPPSPSALLWGRSIGSTHRDVGSVEESILYIVVIVAYSALFISVLHGTVKSTFLQCTLCGDVTTGQCVTE